MYTYYRYGTANAGGIHRLRPMLGTSLNKSSSDTRVKNKRKVTRGKLAKNVKRKLKVAFV